MAHIEIEEGIPGILGPMKFRPETTKPLRELAEVLLRQNNGLTPAERETIAAFVSSRNGCRFCQFSHSAAAAEHMGGGEAHYSLIDSVKADFLSAGISPKLKALLVIAGKVQQGGKHVTLEDVAGARAGCYRPGDPRHRADRCDLLHVQPVCRRARHLATGRSHRGSRDG
jgi:AhpD family alkylhydroperoxidase